MLSDCLRSTLYQCLAVTVAASLLLFAGCIGEDDPEAAAQAGGTVEHPIEELIPHHDCDHISIDRTRSVGELEDEPKKIAFLADYLEEPERFEPQDLDFFAKRVNLFDAASAGKDRLVMLDAEGDEFVEYDLATGEHVRLAEKGEGPGDVQFTQEMVRDGGAFYIAMEDLRIARWNCESSPCEFRERISLDIRARSVAPVGDSLLAVLGDVPHREAEGTGNDAHPVRLIDTGGSVQDTFGAAYESEHEVLVREYLMGGKIRHSKALGLFALVLPDFPYVYIYDEDGMLQATYEVDAFTQGTLEFGSAAGRPNTVTHSLQDRSRIPDISVIDDRLLLLRVYTRTYSDLEPDRGSAYEGRNDYFVIDLAEGESYYVGTDEYTGPPDQALIVTSEGLVINRAGALSFVQH